MSAAARRTIFVALSVGALSICLLAKNPAGASHGGMDAMSIDMNEEATPANTSSALGTRETCARINENNVMDADEDVIDGIVIDVTAQGIPPYNNNGTPLDPSDDTGGIILYGFQLNYSAVNLTVTSEVWDNPGVNILARTPGSDMFLISDALPDDNSDNQWAGIVADTSPTQPEDGTGNMHRITLVSEAAAAAGNYLLTLSDNTHVDAQGAAYSPHVTNNDSYIALNQACGDFDGDGVPDAEDDCPQLPGLASNNGCPPPGPPAVGGTAGLIDGRENGGRSPRLLVAAGAFAAVGLAAVFGWRLLKRGASRR